MSTNSPQPPFGGSYGVPGAPHAGMPGAPAPMPEPAAKKGRAKDSGKPVTKRVISRNVKIAGVFAVLFALLIGALLFGSEQPKLYVAVATADVAPLSLLGETQVLVQPITEELVIAGAITGASPEEVREKVAPFYGTQVMLPIRKGEQINTADFASAAVEGIKLSPTERLISIRASIASAAGGAVKVGDRVDIYGADTSKNPAVVGLIVPDVEVVSVGPSEDVLNNVTREQSSAENKDKSASELLPSKPLGGTYVLRVQLADVNRLLAVDVSGGIYLALRGTDAALEESIPTNILAAICGEGANPLYGIDSQNVAACTEAGYANKPGNLPVVSPDTQPTPAPTTEPAPEPAPTTPTDPQVDIVPPDAPNGQPQIDLAP